MAGPLPRLRWIPEAEPIATCDYCRLEWPVDHLEPVAWTDSGGEEWERRFCGSCLHRLGLT
jgi:hypothetical protein